MEFQESSSLIGQVKVGYDWPKPIDSDWMRTFLGNISKSGAFLNIYGMALQWENTNYKSFHSRPFIINLNDKIFQKTQQVVVFKPFSTGMDLDFYIFLATAKS